MREGKVNIIIGGQAGSEAKGKLSGWLCGKGDIDLLVMTSSPNAGHTLITPEGEKKVSYHLPVGMVMCNTPVLLGPASVIDLDRLEKEIAGLGIDPPRVVVDKRASIITSYHRSSEKLARLSDIGSTLQGVGECRIGKMRRNGDQILAGHPAASRALNVMGIDVVDSIAKVINDSLQRNMRILCETTQGFDLDLEHGIDPVYCTSKMINPSMALAELGVSPTFIGSVYGVIRPYPIRVNNRTGTSGPYDDAKEITWEEVARRCKYPGKVEDFGELTTTTRLPRRVFEFSRERFRRFCMVCRPTHLCLQFANYIDWDAYETTERMELPESVLDWMMDYLGGWFNTVAYVGTGPGHQNMIEL